VKVGLLIAVIFTVLFSVPSLRRRFLGRWAAIVLAALWVVAVVAVLVK
jgi:Ca2+/Na+ antiporter